MIWSLYPYISVARMNHFTNMVRHTSSGCMRASSTLAKMVERWLVGFFCLTIVLLSIRRTLAYGSGAPPMTSVCEQRQPLHRSGRDVIPPQIATPPVSMTTNVSEANGGSIIKVFLSGGNTTFRGFLVEATVKLRENNDDLLLNGEFLPSSDSKQVPCAWNQRMVTHSSPAPKPNITLFYRVPNTAADVRFRATVVQSYKNYWVNVTSPLVSVTQSNSTKSSRSNISRQWLQILVQVARSTARGTEERDSDIRSRFSQGFRGVLNKDNVMASKEILTSLPYRMMEKNGKKNTGDPLQTDSNSAETAISGFLRGKLEFMHTVEAFLQ